MTDKQETTQLEAVDRPFTLVPRNFEDAMKIAQSLSKSDLVPKDYRGKPENCVVAIAWGQEIGLQPLQSLQNIAVINGRASIWGDAALAVVMAHRDFEDIVEEMEGEGDKQVAVCTVKRKGRTPTVRRFSIADARRANLIGKQGPWTQYPDRMLQMRARGFAIRDAFPDAMRGFYLAEELEGVEERDITPPRPDISKPQERQKPAEDVTDADVPASDEKPASEQQEAPAAASEGVACLSTNQLKVIRSKLKAAGLDEKVIETQWQVDRLEAIPAADANQVLDRIRKFQDAQS